MPCVWDCNSRMVLRCMSVTEIACRAVWYSSFVWSYAVSVVLGSGIEPCRICGTESGCDPTRLNYDTAQRIIEVPLNPQPSPFANQGVNGEG
eukprot:1879043-Rhodomonas_salina.1